VVTYNRNAGKARVEKLNGGPLKVGDRITSGRMGWEDITGVVTQINHYDVYIKLDAGLEEHACIPMQESTGFGDFNLYWLEIDPIPGETPDIPD